MRQSGMDRLIAWALDERGVWKTLVAPAPVLALLGALGLISKQSVPIILATVLIFEALVIIAWLNRKLKQAEKTNASQLQEAERNLRQKTRIIERYVERIREGPAREHAVKNWRHVYTYSEHGGHPAVGGNSQRSNPTLVHSAHLYGV